jgi:protein gp37
MNRTSIEWTTFTANPLKYRDASGRVVWACVHASDGCRHCYSEALAHRYRRGEAFTAQAMKGLTPFLDDAELKHMAKAARIGGLPVAGSRCFVGDMTDIFGDWVPDELLNRLFSEVLERRADVTWQLLTKRAERARRYLSWRWPDGGLGPSPNIHVGVSVEDQDNHDRRVPMLRDTPAAVRFLSVEPMLGPIVLDLRGISWVICGGESGRGARPLDVAWARSVVAQCGEAGVPLFMKQVGSNAVFSVDDPNPYGEIRSRKGGDPAEWPEDLRVREMPR